MHLGLVRNRNSFAHDEPIEMRQRRYGYFPRVFRWHGHSYRVHAVDRCWTAMTGRLGGARLCFCVQCVEGTFELYQDLAANTWHVRRARWNAWHDCRPARGLV
jgi:hypothetical protein